MTGQFANPLHLYRALLRETTYLFDRNARSWTHDFVKTSFRRHAAKIQEGKRWKTIPYDPTQTPSLTERHLLKRGRKFLYTLQRANQGYQRQLRNVLQLTYGRKGRERRELMTPWMRLDPQHKEADTLTATLPAKFTKDWLPSEDFMSMLRAQKKLSSHLNIRKTINLDPLPEKRNRWGKPMPPSRVKNITRTWYAKMASIILPPVPTLEWTSLQAKALGKETFNLIPRRPAAKRALEDEWADNTEAAANLLVSGPIKPTSARARMSLQRPHNMTQRYLSRFYARHILNHTPMTQPHPDGKGLIGKWDNASRDVVAAEEPANDAQAESLFG